MNTPILTIPPTQTRPTLVTKQDFSILSHRECRQYRRKYGITGRQMRKVIKQQRRNA